MYPVYRKADRLEVLISQGGSAPWATGLPQTLEGLPVGLHWPRSADEAIGLAADGTVHVGLIDGDAQTMDGGLSLVRRFRRMGLAQPCVLVCSHPSRRVLLDALELNVFSVLEAQAAQDRIADMLLRVGKQFYQFDWSGNAAN